MDRDDAQCLTAEATDTDLQSLLDALSPWATPGTGQDSGLPAGPSHVQQRTVIPARPRLSALDVAAYILGKLGRMSSMKLQKLVYYCQAWSLVWDEAPLFHEPVEAWANGPVIRELFNYHRGMFDLDRVDTGNPALLSAIQRETIDAVLDFYGDKPAQWLIDLSHSEKPWVDARRGLGPSERGTREMPLDAMADYYSSLPAD